jgi:hypothetical protein
MDPNGFVVQLGSIESENKSILVNSTRGTSIRIDCTLGPPPLQFHLYPYPSPCIGTLAGGFTVHPPTPPSQVDGFPTSLEVETDGSEVSS